MAPGKSGLHARGEGERVLALESREGPGENARSWEALGEARPGQSSLSAGALRYRARRHKRHGFDAWIGKIPWRRMWQLTPVFLPRESQGQRSLVGCRLWGRTARYPTMTGEQ